MLLLLLFIVWWSAALLSQSQQVLLLVLHILRMQGRGRIVIVQLLVRKTRFLIAIGHSFKSSFFIGRERIWDHIKLILILIFFYYQLILNLVIDIRCFSKWRWVLHTGRSKKRCEWPLALKWLLSFIEWKSIVSISRRLQIVKLLEWFYFRSRGPIRVKIMWVKVSKPVITF